MPRPNFLILMVDQLTGTLFPDGPAEFLRVPNLRALAERSARFANAYCASPLCAPARASFMTGLQPSRTRVYDNAAEFAADIPTYAHALRAGGYQTALSGKMHFIGPDQLHGFEQRLTTDIYPADYGWTPDYEKPGERIDWWYHNLGSVTGAGVADITNQLEYDDAVSFHARARLRDLSRRKDRRPWCLTVSFTHPHDPYVARREFWDLYEDCPALDPEVPAIPYAGQDPHSRRLLDACEHDATPVTRENIRDARRGYFANTSYVDAEIGKILAVLEASGMARETVIVFTSDHGDMLGERGLWFKMGFHEGSARVPLLFAGPGILPRRIETPVSALDVAPTLTALAGAVPLDCDGMDLSPALRGGSLDRGPVPLEYAAEGSVAPLVCLRDGRFKLILCEADPPLLYDVETDPAELRDLAGDPDHAETLARLTALARDRWDLSRLDAEVRASQARRRLVYAALREGAHFPWEFQPRTDASQAFMRNHMDLNVVEESQRGPRDADGALLG